jgi:hypothetical protein
MKKIKNILMTLLLLLSIGQIQAQDSLQYKSLESFNNDTIKYLEYNYSTRWHQYVGKTVADVINELELPVLYIVPVKKDKQLARMSLGIHQVGDTPNELIDYYVVLSFANPPMIEEFHKNIDYLNGIYDWNPLIYKFVRNLELSGIRTNSYIIMKRENDLKKMKAKEKEKEK